MADPQQIPWYMRATTALASAYGPQARPGGGRTAPMPRTAFPALQAQRSRDAAAIGQMQRPGALQGTPLAPSPNQPAPPLPPGPAPTAFGGVDQDSATPPDDTSPDVQDDAPGGASLAPPGGAGPAGGGPAADSSGGPNVSFKDLWKATPQKQKEQQLDSLEKQVGSIDDAYTQMMQKLGDRPDTKLTRQDKGELLMEFGLHLMAHSAANRHGTDFGGAAGDAGIDALQSYRNMKAQKKFDQETYDRTMGAMQIARDKDKEAVYKQATESAKTSSEMDRNSAEAENARASAAKTRSEIDNPKATPPHWIVHDDKDGFSYAIDPNSGKKMKLGETDPKMKGKGERPFEFQTKFDYYMDVYGKDADGNTLTGGALAKAQKKALDFANRIQDMGKGEAYKTAMNEARKRADNGDISPDKASIDAETESIFQRLHPDDDSGDEEQDVTDQFPKGAIEQLPDGKQVRNSKNQVVIRRGNKVYFVGQQ